jgi:uncharacterized protein YdiU (UPF0061 family)
MNNFSLPKILAPLPGLNNDHFSLVHPTPTAKPQILLWSEEVAKDLGIEQENPILNWTTLLTGNDTFKDIHPVASRYGGHQFGHWAGQLGDGRAMLLAEIEYNQQRFELQLKGAGLTPYSRRADGKAVFRSSLREFLCSEAMHFLGIPTTRALSLALTGDLVVRDLFYDGHPEKELGAITSRVAKSFLRFGHYELHAHLGEKQSLQHLVNYTLERYFPNHTPVEWFESVVQKTLELMTHWLRVGFVHGVMNTDNMSILGLTIDYGPYGWLDGYDPYWTPNTTDYRTRRYHYAHQPSVAFWNLFQLAQALKVIDIDCSVPLSRMQTQFEELWKTMLTQKLGLKQWDPSLSEQLEKLLTSQETDMTLFYHYLPEHQLQTQKDLIAEICYQPITEEIFNSFDQWIQQWRKTTHIQQIDPEEQRSLMKKVNPAFILRNYIVQEAIEEFTLQSKTEKMHHVYQALKTPYDVNDFTRPYLKKRPEWARNKPGCSSLSCSS